jgi:hypothetical protein
MVHPNIEHDPKYVVTAGAEEIKEVMGEFGKHCEETKHNPVC